MNQSQLENKIAQAKRGKTYASLLNQFQPRKPRHMRIALYLYASENYS